MIRINLLPFRAARKSENIRRQVSLFLLSIILSLVAMAAIQMHYSGKLGDLAKRVENTKQEVAKYKKIAKEVDDIKNKLANLEKRTNVMTELDKNRREPVIILDAFTQLVVPNRMWLDSFTSSKGSIKLSGTALDETTTADFLKRLEDSGLFTDVTLLGVRAKTTGGQTMKSFNITCKMGSKEPEKSKKRSRKK